MHKLKSLATLLAIGFLSTSCRPSAPPTGFTTDDIAAAYRQAVSDGKFATHLEPFTHPVLRESGAPNIFLRDGKPGDDFAELTHALRAIEPAELEQLTVFFELPVEPTHALEFSLTRQIDDSSSITTVTPVYLASENSRWHLVYGVPKSADILARERRRESLRFSKSDGLWRYLWELQFAAESSHEYIVAIYTSGGEVVRELLQLTDEDFAADQKMLRFGLWPRGSDPVSETGDGGTVPFYFQVGSRAASDHFNLPGEGPWQVDPVSSPAFSGDRLFLATFSSGAGDIQLAVVRQAGN